MYNGIVNAVLMVLIGFDAAIFYTLDPPGRKEGEEERKRNNEERRNDEKGIGTQ